MSEIKHIHATATIEQFVIPSNIRSKHKTIHEWLTSICHGKKPTETILEFTIRLISSETSGEHIVCLYGVNSRIDGPYSTYTYVVFKPSNLWFKFPKLQYRKCNYEQIQEELTKQVKDFTLTELFQNSFLSKADIKTSFGQNPIWTIK